MVFAEKCQDSVEPSLNQQMLNRYEIHEQQFLHELEAMQTHCSMEKIAPEVGVHDADENLVDDAPVLGTVCTLVNEIGQLREENRHLLRRLLHAESRLVSPSDQCMRNDGQYTSRALQTTNDDTEGRQKRHASAVLFPTGGLMSSGSSSCRSRLGATNSSYTNSGGSVAMVLNSRMRLSRTSAVMEHCQGAPDRLSDMYDTYEESTSQKNLFATSCCSCFTDDLLTSSFNSGQSPNLLPLSSARQLLTTSSKLQQQSRWPLCNRHVSRRSMARRRSSLHVSKDGAPTMLSSTSPSSVSTITSMDVGSASSSVEPVHRSLAVAGNSSMARHYQESSGWMNNMMSTSRTSLLSLLDGLRRHRMTVNNQQVGENQRDECIGINNKSFVKRRKRRNGRLGDNGKITVEMEKNVNYATNVASPNHRISSEQQVIGDAAPCSSAISTVDQDRNSRVPVNRSSDVTKQEAAYTREGGVDNGGMLAAKLAWIRRWRCSEQNIFRADDGRNATIIAGKSDRPRPKSMVYLEAPATIAARTSNAPDMMVGSSSSSLASLLLSRAVGSAAQPLKRFCRLPGKNSSQSKLSDDDQEPTTDSSFIALCNDGVVQRVTNEEGKHCRGVATLLPSNDVVIARQFGEENALLRRDVQRLNVRNNRLIEQLREKSARLSAVHAKCCQLEIRLDCIQRNERFKVLRCRRCGDRQRQNTGGDEDVLTESGGCFFIVSASFQRRLRQLEAELNTLKADSVTREREVAEMLLQHQRMRDAYTTEIERLQHMLLGQKYQRPATITDPHSETGGGASDDRNKIETDVDDKRTYDALYAFASSIVRELAALRKRLFERSLALRRCRLDVAHLRALLLIANANVERIQPSSSKMLRRARSLSNTSALSSVSDEFFPVVRRFAQRWATALRAWRLIAEDSEPPLGDTAEEREEHDRMKRNEIAIENEFFRFFRFIYAADAAMEGAAERRSGGVGAWGSRLKRRPASFVANAIIAKQDLLPRRITVNWRNHAESSEGDGDLTQLARHQAVMPTQQHFEVMRTSSTYNSAKENPDRVGATENQLDDHTLSVPSAVNCSAAVPGDHNVEQPSQFPPPLYDLPPPTKTTKTSSNNVDAGAADAATFPSSSVVDRSTIASTSVRYQPYSSGDYVDRCQNNDAFISAGGDEIDFSPEHQQKLRRPVPSAPPITAIMMQQQQQYLRQHRQLQRLDSSSFLKNDDLAVKQQPQVKAGRSQHEKQQQHRANHLLPAVLRKNSSNRDVMNQRQHLYNTDFTPQLNQCCDKKRFCNNNFKQNSIRCCNNGRHVEDGFDDELSARYPPPNHAPSAGEHRPPSLRDTSTATNLRWRTSASESPRMDAVRSSNFNSNPALSRLQHLTGAGGASIQRQSPLWSGTRRQRQLPLQAQNELTNDDERDDAQKRLSCDASLLFSGGVVSSTDAVVPPTTNASRIPKLNESNVSSRLPKLTVTTSTAKTAGSGRRSSWLSRFRFSLVNASPSGMPNASRQLGPPN